jgi:hypothetical protein
MTRHWQHLERIVRWLKPSPESFAAAAAVHGPGLMLQPKATPGAIEGPPFPECDGHSQEIGCAAARLRPSVQPRGALTHACPAR